MCYSFRWCDAYKVLDKDTTTEMIETIWPLSVLSFGLDSGFDNKDQNIIGLRTFVQEVLRRSKTSYSTLQVALYYVVLIRSRIPKHDFTMEQVVDSHSCRAMQCGRRMFLAALILASKYLQDRNFSARAWSRISGLTPYEINTNEMAFLSAVNWKLHIPEPLFSRWTDLVLKYSLSSSTSPRSPPALRSWRSVIPYLTPDLDHYELEATSISCDSGYRFDRANVPLPPFTLPTKQHLSRPVEVHASPEALTLQSGVVKYNGLVLANKGQPGAGPLLTPRATPKMTPLGIPAASTPGLRGGVASMKVAMAQVKTNCLARSTWDSVDCWKPSLPEVFPTPARRSSLAPMNSTLSSPESMISDNSSRSSRSSSISSVASSTCAPLQPRLALQATRRSAKMQLAPLKENQYPIMHISPNGNALQDAILASPHVMTIPTSQPTVTPCQPTPEAPVINPCDILRAHDASAHEAATTLRDLALNLYPIITCSGNSRKRENPAASDSPLHNPTDNQESGTQPNLMRSRKRERTSSIDLSVQSRVRDLIAPRCLGDITNGRMTNPGISTVLPDRTLPDSILGSVKIKPSELGDKCSSYMVHDSLPRKRACGLSGREESRRIDRLMKERAAMPAPGMWEGII